MRAPSMLMALAFFSLLSPPSAQARWATEQEAQYAIEKREVEYKVHHDGTFELESADRYRIQTDQARSSLGTMQLQYNEAAETLEILAAATLNGSQRLDVPRSQIVDKPISNNRQGFDQIRQFTIAFPEVRVGSILILKTLRRVRYVTVPNQFSQDDVHGRIREEKTSIHIRSELPLYWRSSSADGQLAVECNTQGPRLNTCLDLSIRTLHPIHWEAIDETQPFASWDQFPGWVVTSSLDWSAYYQSLAREWEQKIQGDTPKVLQEMIQNIKAAQGKRGGSAPNRVAQLNQVMAQVAETFRYMGDWRPVRGGWVPRALGEIAENRSGDCKDLTMVTVALLREFGIEATPALTVRGEKILPLPWQDIPHQSFNHAIVAVTDPAVVQEVGHVVYVDGTNPMAFAQGTPPDIAGRQAVLLHPDAPIESVTTPMGSPIDNRIEIALKLNPIQKSPGAIQAKGSLTRTGDLAFFLAGAELSHSAQTIGRQIVLSIQDEKLLGDWSVAPFDLKSRIARDLTFNFEFNTLRPSIRTSAGFGYTPNVPPALSDLFVPVRNRVTGMWLNLPYRRRLRTEFHGVRKQGSVKLDCKIKSPWALFERKIATQAHGFRVDDDYTLLTRWISARDLQSDSFKSFQTRLANCVEHTVVVYR